jgi:uncharacterized protein YutE (UPF0331/DUF86 family)
MRTLLDDLDAVGDVSVARLTDDRMLRYAVERVLTQLVDLAVGINGHLAAARLGTAPATYRESFVDAARAGALPADLAERLAPAVGLRNVLTHEYVAVDLRLVVRGVELARVDVRDYVRQVASSLEQ